MGKERYKDMWVYIELEDGNICPVSLELCCEVRKLCDISKDRLVAVVAGGIDDGKINELSECGVDGIITVRGRQYERYNTEAYTDMFCKLCRKYMPSAVFVGASANGRDFAPRFAARLETGCTSDATEVIYNTETCDLEFVEPAAGGKIMAVITIPELRPQVATIRPGAFKYLPRGKAAEPWIIEESIEFPEELIRSKLIDRKAEAADPDLDISSCDTIVCVGAGLKSAEDLARYKELADLLGGKVACTRPIADKEWLPAKLQVGQSGVNVKPHLYIGFGISGAVNHVAGVDADIFVAVNNDPSAAIFNYCDYGIVGDMDEVCDALISELS